MERRKDYRHDLNYLVSIRCPRSRKVLDGLTTDEVSASGLTFSSHVPHGLDVGDRVEIQMIANVDGEVCNDMLVMATRATVVRADDQHGALRFEAPLAY